MIDINKAKDRFGTWGDKFLPFLSGKEFENIFSTLKELSRKGYKIFPDSTKTFRAFELCKYQDTKLVIMGLSPYHTTKNGEVVADGLCLSCGITRQEQPSLFQVFNALEKELYNGLNLNMTREPDLSYLATQGILMYNASLTVIENRAGCHVGLWEPFNKFLFQEIFSNMPGLIFLFLGKEAARYEKYTNPLSHYVFKLPHPAAASYIGKDWDSEGVFTKINHILEQNNGKEYTIKWIKEDSEDCPF